ncbi:DUF3857 domain-containing protein [Saccharicrinis sp. FJH2]|uniref:DUF3857 domain-containing protein n=1 Tax=Saccharicrinis sp. FJH65 TaxID=3344659 RepID=UPI0035F26636
MKKIILLTLVALTALTLHAEKIIMEMGSVSMSELNIIKYDKDPDAEALKIFDLGQSEFIQEEGQGFILRFRRQTRIKILDEAGLDYAEVEIPVFRTRDTYESVEQIKGASYRLEDGQLVKSELDKKDVHIEKVNEYWSMYKFVIPDVRKGSVIEYSYEIYSPRIFYLKDWEFQSRIPTMYSEYITKMIPFYEYVYILKGATSFDVYENNVSSSERYFAGLKFKDNIFKVGMRNVPAFRDESFITTKNDYILSLDFQLAKINFPQGGTKEIMTTWEKMVEEYEKDPEFGKFITKCQKYASKILDMDKVMAMNPEDRFEYIVDYVKSGYSWNGFISRYASKKVKELVKEKRGDVADINLFLTGLLRASGFEAYPVFLSTRDNGKIHSKYPFTDFFNHLVVYVKDGDLSYMTDGTDYLCDDRRIPERCLNDKGLIIKKGPVEWINLNSKIESEYRRNLTLNVDPDSSSAEVIIIASEYEALRLRKKIGGDEDKLRTYYEDGFGNDIDSVVFIKNAKERNKPYLAAFKSDIELTQLNDKIYVAPFLAFAGSDNPFKQKERKLPIDMVKISRNEFTSTIKIPDGYEVDFEPMNKTVDNSLFEFDYSIQHDDKAKELNVKMIYKFKEKDYPATDYNKLKSYFEIILEKANENIVLKKSEV